MALLRSGTNKIGYFNYFAQKPFLVHCVSNGAACIKIRSVVVHNEKGMNMILRKVISSMKPTVELRKEGDNYILASVTTLKTVETKFMPGQVMEGARPDGSKIKNIFTFESKNVLKQVESDDNGLVVTYVREFGPTEMKAIMSANGVTSSRVFKAV